MHNDPRGSSPPAAHLVTPEVQVTQQRDFRAMVEHLPVDVEDERGHGPVRPRTLGQPGGPAEPRFAERRVPPTVAAVEAIDGQRCILTSGSDSLDAIALHVALLDVPFTPLEPPELRLRCAALAGRLHQAAGRFPG